MLFDLLGLGVLVAGYSGIAVLAVRNLWRSRGNEIIAPPRRPYRSWADRRIDRMAR